MEKDIVIENSLSKLFDIDFDKDNNVLSITPPTDNPLTIKFNGNINFMVEKDLVLESNKSINMLTHGDLICFDSVDSAIHLNSYMCNKLKDTDKAVKIRKHLKHQQEKRMERLEMPLKMQTLF